MRCMIQTYSRARSSNVFFCLIPLMFFFLQSFSARQWDTKGASKAYEEAQEKRNAIAPAAKPVLSLYLECVKIYRKVYSLDPHYKHAPDAIYEEALLYQEMGDKFSNTEHYKTAVKRFNFLVNDYGTNQNCPDALMRIAAIYSKHLKDEAAAQEAYQRLRAKYKSSYDSLRQTHPEIAGKTAPEAPAKSAPKKPSNIDPASVQNIRYWSTRDYTRVIIDLDSETAYKKSRLTNPDRVLLDISNAKLSKDLLNQTIAVGDNYLKQIRATLNESDLVRVVLEVSEGINYSVSELHDPFRIVVDLRGLQSRTALAPLPHASNPRPDETPSVLAPKTASSPSKSAKSTTNTNSSLPEKINSAVSHSSPKAAHPTSRGDRTLTRILGLKIGRIVIDPGHGGHDDGSSGPGGLLEKDLVLSVAHMLKTMLEEKLGAEVLLTRDDDTFIPLDERTAFANNHHADLFISIHANSSRSHSVSGVETYYLDFAKTDAEREIASKENAASEKNVRDLEDLLKKIVKADKSAESRELASLIQQKLFTGAKELLPSTHNRGVRKAPFVVLIGANMPSILAEVAFISNPKDEKLLGKKTNQETIAKSLFAGVEEYVNALGSEKAPNQISKNR
jgi:N-acetylmuramoyl-L-alanine amidase